jgi:eukaryotic-like serine/threonine-protein kinase
MEGIDCVSVRAVVADEVLGNQDARALSGRLLCGKWLLEGVVGVGGTSTVYQARHRNGKAVAVKILHPHLAAIPAAKKRFLEEASLTNKVGHAGVVSVLDDDVADDGTVFLVMDLLRGETLAARLERERVLAWTDVAEWIADLLDVLAAAHDKGVIHRDLKPSNVFLTCDGQVKVLDFGVGRVRELHNEGRTPQGVALGTPGFMAPEQARGGLKIDERADLWSVGATMFLALTGRAVHLGSSINALMIASATQAAPPIQRFASVPSSVAEVINRSLRLDPNERWPDARSMCTALLCAQQSSRTETTSPTTLATSTEHDLPVASGYPRERRVSGWRSAVVALAVVATGFGASAMLRPAPRLASTAPKAVAPPSSAAPQTSTDELKSPALVSKVESRAAGSAKVAGRPHPTAEQRHDAGAKPPPHLSAAERAPKVEAASPGGSGRPTTDAPVSTEHAWPNASSVILDRWP